jgi:hypothetical protein
VDDNAADGVVLARSSTGDDEQRKPIAIDRDPALFKQVLVTSIVNTPRNTVKVPDAEAALLWAELDFYGLLPQMKGGESVSKGKRKMLPAAVLRHETARDSAKTAKLLDTRKALITRDNTEMVSLIVSQMSEIVARKLLTRSQANQTLGETSDALLHTANPEPAANLEGTDWSMPFEQRLALAPVPPVTASETEQCFVVNTGMYALQGFSTSFVQVGRVRKGTSTCTGCAVSWRAIRPERGCISICGEITGGFMSIQATMGSRKCSAWCTRI